VDARAKSIEQLFPALQIFFESIQTFLIPAREHFMRAAGDERDVHLNFRRLPDSVEPADALFEKLRIQRQIKKHQMMRKLKIPAFTPDFRADQYSRSVLLGKPGSVAVPLD